MPGGNGADFIDVETLPNIAPARQGAGSVHHIAFAVEDRAEQLEVRKALMDTGYMRDAGDRPRLFLGDLFPHARRRAVRGRHQRAGLRPRRGHRPSRRGAEAAARSTRICARRWKSSSSRSRIEGGRHEPGRLHLRRSSRAPGAAGVRVSRHGRRRAPALGRSRAPIWPRAEIVAPRGDVSEHGALRFFRRTAEGRLRHGGSRAGAPRAMAAFVRRPQGAQGARRIVGSAIPTAPTSSPRWRSPSPGCSTNWC